MDGRMPLPRSTYLYGGRKLPLDASPSGERLRSHDRAIANGVIEDQRLLTDSHPSSLFVNFHLFDPFSLETTYLYFRYSVSSNPV